MPPVRVVALLRGINVGPTTQVPMALLRDVAEGLGLRDVATHLRSGNLIATAEADRVERLGDELGAALRDALGFDVPVLVRTRDEIAAVLADDPLGEVAADPARHVVVFLATPVVPEEVRALLPGDVGPEAVHITPRHIQVWAPAGVSRSPVLAALTAPRGPAAGGTVRNRRTVAALLGLLDATGPGAGRD
jgi:uncharacterized protein (DUF1697 family)